MHKIIGDLSNDAATTMVLAQSEVRYSPSKQHCDENLARNLQTQIE